MNKKVTSKEELLIKAKELVKEGGLKNLDMRKIASKSNIALGSTYNYFESKSDLINQTIESIFKEVMSNSYSFFTSDSFIDTTYNLYISIKELSTKYPSFIKDHTIYASKDGYEIMNKYLTHIKLNLLNVLKKDSKVDETAFNNVLTKEGYVTFIFNNLNQALTQDNYNIDLLIEVIKKTIYKKGN